MRRCNAENQEPRTKFFIESVYFYQCCRSEPVSGSELISCIRIRINICIRIHINISNPDPDPTLFKENCHQKVIDLSAGGLVVCLKSLKVFERTKIKKVFVYKGDGLSLH